MNYQRIYDQIIDRARDRELDCYREKHHVTPKCLGGSNNKSNLVKLTAREHFICHLLLVEIYPENEKLQFAAWAMSNQTQNKNQDRGYRVSARLYERLKCYQSNRMTERNLKYKHSPKSLDKMSEHRIAFYQTEQGEAFRKKQSVDMKVFLTTPKGVEKSAVRLAVVSIPIYQYAIDGVLIKKWPSRAEAGRSLQLDPTNISNCLAGRQKTAGGFLWK